MTTPTLKNVAVLIDADNASAKNIAVILAHIQTYAHIATKKVYGDWSNPAIGNWQEATLRHALEPMQQFAYVKGKNATDIALVIEAMDLLHSGAYDGFCLVSSDSDFASLAVRIRKNGLKVVGYGEKKAVSSFRQACDEFVEVESLQKAQPAQKWDNQRLKQDTKLMTALQEAVRDTKSKTGEWSDYSQLNKLLKGKIDPKKYGYTKIIELFQVIDTFSVNHNKNTQVLMVKSKQPLPAKKSTTQELQADKALTKAITNIILGNPKADNGWTSLSYVASHLKQQNINTDHHGYKKFSDLISAIRLFDIKKQPNGIYVKTKTVSQKPTPAPKPTTNEPTLPKPTHLTGKINIHIYHQEPLDSVLWRLGTTKKTRHDDDIVFYGQTHTADDSIHLESHELFDCFACDLSAQSLDVQYLTVSVSHDQQITKPIKVVIEQQGAHLFVSDYLPAQQSNSALLFVLNRQAQGWQFVAQNKPVNHDLFYLCQFFGIEVEE